MKAFQHAVLWDCIAHTFPLLLLPRRYFGVLYIESSREHLSSSWRRQNLTLFLNRIIVRHDCESTWAILNQKTRLKEHQTRGKKFGSSMGLYRINGVTRSQTKSAFCTLSWSVLNQRLTQCFQEASKRLLKGCHNFQLWPTIPHAPHLSGQFPSRGKSLFLFQEYVCKEVLQTLYERYNQVVWKKKKNFHGFSD